MKNSMIKVILVRLDGDKTADGLRLGTARDLAELFDAQITGLYLNVLPAPVTGIDLSVEAWSPLVGVARKAGDTTAAELTARLSELDRPSSLRRFDVFEGDIDGVCARGSRR